MFLAPILAMLAGQAEPTGTPGATEAPATQEEPPTAPASPAHERPPRAERPQPSPAGAQERPAPPARSTEPERAQVARAALAFLDALLAGDATRLAAASADRFSFDGDLRTGKEEIRRSWNTLLARRDVGAGARPALLDLELLPAAEAVSRLGSPPPRLAQLAGVRGSWVAVANVSRRPVVLFLAREAGRWTVTGME